MSRNGVDCNYMKTKFTVFEKRSTKHSNIVIGDHEISSCEYYKYLGLHLDKKLNFVTHIEELQVYANEQNLVTRTQNCQVQLLVEKDGIRKNIDVNSRKTIDDSLPIAVKKKLKVFPVARNHGDEKKPTDQ